MRPGLLFLGTERGVWVSFNDGESWQQLQRNLPVTQVSDLAVSDHDLVIATHGRSFWVMDKIDVLRQIGPEDSKGDRVRLFAPAPSIRGVDDGVAVDYFLPAAQKSLAIDILDPQGKLVQSFEGTLEEPKAKKPEDGDDGKPPKPSPRPLMKAGLNRFTWTMRYPGFTRFDRMILWTSRNQGVMAPPAKYTARLRVAGQTQSQPFEVQLDPRIKNVTHEMVRARFDLAMAVSSKVSEANAAVLLARGIRQQIDALIKHTPSPSPALRERIEKLGKRIGAVEGEIYQVRNASRQDPLNYPIKLNDKMAGLIRVIDSAEGPVTDQSRAVFADLSSQLDGRLAALAAVLDADLPSLNSLLAKAGLPAIERKALKASEPGQDDDDSASAAEEEEEGGRR